MGVLPLVPFFISAGATDDVYGGPSLVRVYYFQVNGRLVVVDVSTYI